MSKINQTEQKEIGRIRLSDTQDLVASLIDKEKLDLRIFIKSDIIRERQGEVSDFIYLIIIGLSLRSSLIK